VRADRALAGAADRVARQLHLISDHQNIGRLQLAVHQVLPMQERERIQYRREHLPRLIIRQSTVRQQLRQSLVGVLHEHIEIRQALELASAPLQERQEIRMRKAARPLPARQQQLGQGPIGGHELDGDFRGAVRRRAGKKHSAVIR
jgi:hypothetical protein